MSEIDELKQALDELAGVQLIDNTWQEAEAVRREITGIIQALHRDLCAEASSACQQWDAKCRELERRLALVTALVPEAAMLQRMADDADHMGDKYAIEASLGIPGAAENERLSRIDDETARALADRIRAWRGDGDGGEEQEGESDGD